MGDSNDTTARDALVRVIAARLLRCNHDELRVIDVLLARLELGRDRYGHLDLARARDWDRDEAEELLDMRVYHACAAITRRDEQLARLRCEVADEIAALIEPGLRELRDADLIVPSASFGTANDWPSAHDLGGEG